MLPNWTENTIEVNGISIHYTRTGVASGKPPVVLVHGFSDYGMCWWPLARDLQDEYDVIMPDAYGHGYSDRVRPDHPANLPGDLAGLIRKLRLERPVIAGHSMGGWTAANMEAHYPGTAKALILEDPGWFIPKKPEEMTEEEKKRASQPDPWRDWLNSVKGTPIDQVMAKCRADSPTWKEEEVRPWAESKLLYDPNYAINRAMRSDWREDARKLDVPTLLITADPSKGAIITPEMAQLAKSLSPFIREANIPGVGHCIRREAGEAYLTAVRQFLSEVR